MSKQPMGWLGALALTVVVLGFPGTASADVIVACKAKTTGILRVVGSATECRTSEVAISWNAAGQSGPPGAQGVQGPTGPAGPGVKTIAGFVVFDGTLAIPGAGAGVTATRLGEGSYRITFAAGTWSTSPIMTVTPLGMVDDYKKAHIMLSYRNGDGSAVVEIDMVGTFNGVDVRGDNSFTFIAVASP